MGCLVSGLVYALESTYSGNYIVPEFQSGFYPEQYEVRVGKKLQRGLENFFLGWLEIPHQIRLEMEREKKEYYDRRPIAFFRGFGKGLGRATLRTAVGFYEIFTLPYAQEPILEEMHEWW